MTPEEHYAEAERLLALAATFPADPDETNPAATLTIAEAQVHATLATYIPPTIGTAARVTDWLDAHGDTWRELGNGELRIVAQKHGSCHALGLTCTRTDVEQYWGPLVQAVTR